MLPLLFIVLCAQAVDLADEPSSEERVPVEVGVPYRGEITPGDEELYRIFVEKGSPTLIGKSFYWNVTEPGIYSIELESMDFPPTLMLRDWGGGYVARGDDLGVGVNKRIEIEVTEPREFRVDTCSGDDRRGSFELRITEGAGPALSAAERQARDRESMRFRLAYTEERHGTESAEFAIDLYTVGNRLHRIGDYRNALDYLTRSLEIARKVLGPAHWHTQFSMKERASTLQTLARMPEARQELEKLLALQVELYGLDSPTLTPTRFNLANTLTAMGELAAAGELLESALGPLEATHAKARREGHVISDSGWLSQTHEYLSDVRALEGNYERSEFHARRGLEESVREGGEESHTVYMSKVRLGQVLMYRGKLDQARTFLEEGHAGLVGLVGPDHHEVSQVLAMLGRLQYHTDDFEGALESTGQAIVICERVFGPNHPKLIPLLSARGNVQFGLGDHKAVVETLRRSLGLSDRYYGRMSFLSIQTRAALGMNLFRLDELGAAEVALVEALQDMQTIRAPDHPAVAEIRYVLAVAVSKLGDHEEAVALYEESLPALVKHRGRGARRTGDALEGLVTSLIELGRGAQAWALWQEYWPDRAAMVESDLCALTESERVAYLGRIRVRLDRMVELAVAIDEPGMHEQAYAAVLNWKGWGTRLLLSSRETLAAGLGAESRELAERLRDAQAELAALAYDRESAARDWYDVRLAELRRARNAAELELQRSLGRATGAATTPAELRASLPPRSAVVDFLVDDHLRAWISLPGGAAVTYLDLGPAAELEAAARAHLRAVQEGGDPAAGARLRELLWGPLAAELGDAELVFVSPDGFLGGLPFGTIPLDEKSYLLEERAFAYLQDSSSLPRIQAEAQTEGYGSLLVCGGLDFDDRSGLRPDSAGERALASVLRGPFSAKWEALPATAGEAKGVAAQFEQWSGGETKALVLLGADATEERIRQEFPRHAVLHLATHGFFAPEGFASMWSQAVAHGRESEAELGDEPERLAGLHPGVLTGLVWAGANTTPEPGRDDGYLTAEELQWLDLAGVELMVLSACETAVGRARAGEGMIGLRRACRVAGARTVVSSLWMVTDDSTSQLMTIFYRNLWARGMGRLEALREAQLQLLEEHRPPSAWGAFTLSGDWR